MQAILSAAFLILTSLPVIWRFARWIITMVKKIGGGKIASVTLSSTIIGLLVTAGFMTLVAGMLWGFRNEIMPYALAFFDAALYPVIISAVATLVDLLPGKSPLFQTFLEFFNCLNWGTPFTIVWTGYSISCYAIIVRNTLRI